jgi:hypothetical protein
MSGYCGPKIITSNLIMNLDASDLNSRYGTNYNLLDFSTWTIGSGSSTGTGNRGYSANGTSAENIRDFGTDPFSNTSIIWKSISDGDYGSNGGWNGTNFNTDTSKTHRFSVWIQKYFTGNNSGSYYLGLYGYNSAGVNAGVFQRAASNITVQPTCSANNHLITASAHGMANGSLVNFYTGSGFSGVLPGNISANSIYYIISSSTDQFAISTTNGGTPITMSTSGTHPFYADGNLNSNFYFHSPSWSSRPLLVSGSWYLLVGHAFGSGSGMGSVHPDSGVYDITGSKIYSSQADCVLRTNPANTRILHRAYLYYATGSAGNTMHQWFFYPRVDILDGTQPSIADLINNNPNKFKNLVNPNQFAYIQGNLNTISKSFGGYYTPASQTNQYIVLPETCLQSLTSGYTWSLEFWMEPMSSLAGAYGPTMTVSGSDDLAFSWSATDLTISGSTLTTGSNPTYTVNTSMLITLTRNTSTWRLYKNGVFSSEYSYTSADTKTIVGWVADQDQNSVKGGFQSSKNVNANWYNFKLYNGILTDTEILNNYNVSRTKFGL